MTLNLTLTALSISNLCMSPIFSTGRNKITFSFLNIYNSFSTSILAECSLHISNSIFKNFLSSAISITSSAKPLQIVYYRPNTVTDSTLSRTLLYRCHTQNNGGGILCINENTIRIDECFFAFCFAEGKGGALYANATNSSSISVSNTCFLSCTAYEGSSFFIDDLDNVTFNYNNIEESAPSRRPGISSNGIIISKINNIVNVNFTSCYSVRSSAAIRIDCLDRQVIRFTTFQQCNGFNIICFKGIGSSSLSRIENLVIINNSLNGNQAPTEEDRYEGKALICIMGYWFISDSFFFSNDGLLASGGYGIITFFRCKFDFSLNLTENRNIITLECFENSQEQNQIPIYSFTANDYVYTGLPCFSDETINEIVDPPKPKFVLKKKIGYIIAGIVFTLVFAVVSIYACILLKRHRQHVLCMLHNQYAIDGKSSDEGDEKDIDKNMIVVVDENEKKKKEKKKKDLQNDFDDYYDTVRKDNRFQFEDIPVPDTHLWDTNEGDVEVPDDDAFIADVDDIMDNFNKKSENKKKTKKKKKKLTSLIKKGKKKK